MWFYTIWVNQVRPIPSVPFCSILFRLKVCKRCCCCVQNRSQFSREGKLSLEQIIRREKERGCLHLLLFVRDAKLTLSTPGPMREPRPAGKDRALGRLWSGRSQCDARARQSNCGRRLLVHLSPVYPSAHDGPQEKGCNHQGTASPSGPAWRTDPMWRGSGRFGAVTRETASSLVSCFNFLLLMSNLSQASPLPKKTAI